jgi:hypothetical protein
MTYYGSQLYKYEAGALTRISTIAPRDNTTEYAYSDENFQDLIYTAEYDSDGNLISKDYNAYTENYDGTGYLKREKTTSGDVYEYLDEDYGDGYGRMTLLYDQSEGVYKTYDWGTTQVEVTEYSGNYSPVRGSNVRSGVIPPQATTVYVYDHNGEQRNLDPATNNWLMREKGVCEIRTTGLLTVGGAHKDTSQKKFGTASAYFENTVTDDLIGVAPSYKWQFEVDDEWTVDGWFNLETMGFESYVFMAGESSPTSFYAVCLLDFGVSLVLPDGQGGLEYHDFVFNEGQIATNNWYHLAMVSDGTGALRAYINGEQLVYDDGMEGAPFMPIDDVDFGQFTIGGTENELSGIENMNGWIDDFRISDFARWTNETEYTPFVPPQSEALIELGTVFRVDANGGQGDTNFASSTLDGIEYTSWDELERITEYFNLDNDQYTIYEYSVENYLIYKEIETVSLGFRRGEWFFNDVDNRMQKFTDETTGEAAIYFNVDGYKTETYWGTDGTVSHWNTATDYDNDIKQWYINSSGELELYTWYGHDPGSRVKWKDLYQWNPGTEQWDWYDAYEYDDSGDAPFGDNPTQVTQGTTGADDHFITPGKPVIEESAEASVQGLKDIEAFVSHNKLSDPNLQLFFDRVESIKKSSSGEGILVSLLDSGIDASRVRNVVGGYDFAGTNRYSDDTDEDHSDNTGHGTETARVLNATAQDADILAVKIMDDYGKTSSSIVGEAIKYAVDMGSKVIAMPFTLLPVNRYVEDAVEYASKAGAVLIASAGNEGEEVSKDSLAGQDNVITVGSVDNNNKLSAWTNTGEEVDLYAPWDVIEIAASSASLKLRSSPRNDNEAGTSFSAAFVAGLAALILEDQPGFTAYDVLSELDELFSGIAGNGANEKTDDKVDEEILNETLSKNEMIRKSVEQFTGNNITFDDVIEK